jgi:hypothetical protein
MKSVIQTIVVMTTIAAAAVCLAAGPPMMNFQGVLSDDVGIRLDGIFDLTFSIYPHPEDDNYLLWSEHHETVEVHDGVFHVVLGSSSPMPPSLFESDALWMSVAVGDDSEMEPRMRLTSSPWSAWSAVADTALAGGGTAGSDSDWIISGNNMHAGVSGNVGIGTATPEHKVEINGQNELVGLRLAWGDAYPGLAGDFTHERSGGLVINSTTSSGAGTWADLHLQTNNNTRMFIDSSGKIGMGTTVPSRLLHLDNANTADGIRVAFGSSYTSLFADFVQAGSGGLIINSNAGGTWADISFQTNGVTRMFLDSYGNLGLGTTSPSAKLHVEGTLRADVLQITGADMAENFPCDQQALPGSVMAIDTEQPGQLCLARGQYNRQVAGVVSGAGDLYAGAILGSDDEGLNNLPVALSGRVWVRCTADDKSIQPGDLLTTSQLPGVAMKACDPDRTYGSVIGKAMTGLESGQGLVLVLVSLH